MLNWVSFVLSVKSFLCPLSHQSFKFRFIAFLARVVVFVSRRNDPFVNVHHQITSIIACVFNLQSNSTVSFASDCLQFFVLFANPLLVVQRHSLSVAIRCSPVAIN